MPTKTVSERIASIKTKFDLNNVELSSFAGVSKQAVGKWVNQNAVPDAAAAVNLRLELGINEAWLILGKGPMMAAPSVDGITSEFLRVVSQLDDDQKAALNAVAKSMLKTVNK